MHLNLNLNSAVIFFVFQFWKFIFANNCDNNIFDGCRQKNLKRFFLKWVFSHRTWFFLWLSSFIIGIWKNLFGLSHIAENIFNLLHTYTYMKIKFLITRGGLLDWNQKVPAAFHRIPKFLQKALFWHFVWEIVKAYATYVAISDFCIYCLLFVLISINNRLTA
jgi:hypothetical protein